MNYIKFIAFFGLLVGSLCGEVRNSEKIPQKEIRKNELKSSSLKKSDTSFSVEGYSKSETIKIRRTDQQYNRWSYAAAHAFGALAVEGVTVGCGMAGWVVGSFLSWSPSGKDFHKSGPVIGGLIGTAGGLTLGLLSTEALGGSKKAIAAGCIVGLVTSVFIPNQPLLPIISTMAVSGTVASWDF